MAPPAIFRETILAFDVMQWNGHEKSEAKQTRKSRLSVKKTSHLTTVYDWTRVFRENPVAKPRASEVTTQNPSNTNHSLSYQMI
jgi:hypothetical protein